MGLVTPAEVRAVVPTTLRDVALDAVIAAVEAEVTAYAGPPAADETAPHVEEHGGGTCNLYLARRVARVLTVVEDDALREAADYRVWAAQGRLERLPAGARWGAHVVVTYLPAPDTVLRRGVIIDLVRLDLERTAMKQERLADGEYSYVAPDNWDEERARVLRRLTFLGVG